VRSLRVLYFVGGNAPPLARNLNGRLTARQFSAPGVLSVANAAGICNQIKKNPAEAGFQ
jgi:hypothetical protein